MEKSSLDGASGAARERPIARCAFALFLLLAACAGMRGHPSAYGAPVADVRLSRAPRFDGLRSVEGRSLVYWVFGSGEPVTLIFAGIHGSEPSGVDLVWRFLEFLDRNPDVVGRGTIVVAPLVNPDGLAHGERWNARGVDLNRNFPASNRDGSPRSGPAPASEPETRFVLSLIDLFRPERIVSLHAPLGCVNWDGPADLLARVLSAECGLPGKAEIGYPTPGSFGSWAGRDLRIPTITLELAERDEVSPDHLEKLRRALLLAHRALRGPVL